MNPLDPKSKPDSGSQNNQSLLELKNERQRVREMGGPKNVGLQKGKGKWDVRRRIEYLFDPHSFTEIGAHVDHSRRDKALAEKSLAADGLVAGYGSVSGKQAYVIAYDFTVLGGSMGHNAEKKASRIREMAAKSGGFLFWIIDSAGARVSELGGSFFAQMGDLFYEQVQLSGVVNQVCLVLGPGVAGTAYIPGLSDIVIMSRQNSFLALAGPALVEAAISETISESELGGSHIHGQVSGVAHYIGADDKQCFDYARKYAKLLSGPVLDSKPDGGSRSKNETHSRPHLDQIQPDDPQSPFDMTQVIAEVFDPESRLEFMPEYGPSLICEWATVAGQSVGVVANQSAAFGGIITSQAALKAARFIQICDMNNLPLVFLHDVPGFMVGSQAEKAGIIKHGSAFLFAMAKADVPKISIVVRKSYGAGYFVMCGRGFKPDALAAWPLAEIALMGAEGAVNILFKSKLSDDAEGLKKRAQLVASLKKEINIYQAAREFGIDDLILPSETRQFIVSNLERCKANVKKDRKASRKFVFPI